MDPLLQDIFRSRVNEYGPVGREGALPGAPCLLGGWGAAISTICAEGNGHRRHGIDGKGPPFALGDAGGEGLPSLLGVRASPPLRDFVSY